MFAQMKISLRKLQIDIATAPGHLLFRILAGLEKLADTKSGVSASDSFPLFLYNSLQFIDVAIAIFISLISNKVSRGTVLVADSDSFKPFRLIKCDKGNRQNAP